MARKRRFRIGSPIVFAGRRLSAGSALAVSQFGSLRRLGSANIELVDVVLRRPSLDDVFFALTNESATRTSNPAAATVTT